MIALIALLAFPGTVGAARPAATPPDHEWTRQFGSAGYETIEGIAVDGLGRSYIVGVTDGAVAASGNKGSQDAFVRSYTRSGTHRWTRQFGTSAYEGAKDVAVDGDGNVVIVGATGGKLPGPYRGGRDAWVRKYRPDGRLLWARQFGTPAEDEGRAVAIDRAGNIFVAGETGGGLRGTPKGGTDAFLRMYSPTGVHRWTRQFGTSTEDWIEGAAADSKGNAWAIGGTDGNLAGDNAGRLDALVRKYDTSGRHRWTRQLGTTEDDFAADAEPDGSGNLLVAGSSDGAMPGGGSDPAGSDVFVLKLSASGGLVWTRQFGSEQGEYPEGIDVDGRGNTHVGGSTSGQLPGQTQQGGGDAFVRSYGPGGALRWTIQLGSDASDGVKGVAVRRVDEVYLGGQTEGQVAAPLKGGADGFVRRLAR